MYFADLGTSIISSFETFMYSICSFVYELIIYLYDLFDLLCHGRLIENDFMQAITFRVGLILGLVMFFRVIFSFIQYLVEPDTMMDKEKGAFNLVKKILIVILMLGIYSYIFDLAFKVQGVILGDNDGNVNVVSRLLLPEVIDSDNVGGVLSSDLFLSFYTMNDGIEEVKNAPRYETCSLYRDFLATDIADRGEFSLGYNCLDETSVVNYKDASGNETTARIIKFNYILAIAVGLFVCWALLMYCISIGLRIIQLAFLEIIAPMAIISHLAPGKDNAFQKWWKMCMTTYFDVFIRVAIINFIVLLIANIISGFDSMSGMFWESLVAYGGSGTEKYLVFLKIIMIMALLMFAKKAPELLKELLPKSWTASGDYGFSLKKRLDNMVGGKQLQSLTKDLPSKAIGFGLGGLAGGAMSAASRFNTKMRAGKGFGSALGAGIMGLGVGAFRGGFGSAKKGNVFKNVGSAIKDVQKADNAHNELILSGGSALGRIGSSIVDKFGETKGQLYNRLMKNASTVAGYRDAAYEAIEKTTALQGAKAAVDGRMKEENESERHFRDAKARMQKNYDNQADAAFEAAVNKTKFNVLQEDGSSIELSGYEWQSQESFDLSKVDFYNPDSVIRARNNFETDLRTHIQQYRDRGGNATIDVERIMHNFDEYMRVVSDPDYFGEKDFIYDMQNITLFDVGTSEKPGPDDRRISQVNAHLSQAKSFVNATNTVYFDQNGQEHKFVFEGDGVDAGAAFRAAKKMSDYTTVHVTSQPDYASSLANDKAAGVDSGSSKK